ncbi:hypothetical protein CRUP_020167, partial [Coryphaenoides rupestris]
MGRRRKEESGVRGVRRGKKRLPFWWGRGVRAREESGVNTLKPLPLANAHTSLPEDAAVDTIVLRVNATDADSGLFAAIEYSLAGGDGKFGINPATSLLLSQGDIYILALLDRETKNRYTLTAIARDNPRGSPNNRRENAAQVLVTVLDVNDFRPRFAQRIFNTSVFENEPSGSSVITLSATDLDEGENGRLLYSMRGAGA